MASFIMLLFFSHAVFINIFSAVDSEQLSITGYTFVR